MDLLPVYAHDIAVIQADKARSYLEIEWFAHPDSAVFREVVTRAHTYGHQHQITKWLCNLDQAEFLEMADQQWLVAEIFTALNPALKYRYAYIIRPIVSEVVTAYHILDLVAGNKRLTNMLSLAIFNEMDMAQHWLFTIAYPKPHLTIL